MRTLAAEAGVSPMTVSLALRNHRSISPAMRTQLQRLAEERGYRPDPKIATLMHHLRTRRPARVSSVIAALSTEPKSVRLPYFIQMLDAAQARANELGYAFEPIYLQEHSERGTSLQRLLHNRGVEGVLLLPMGQPQNLESLLDWKKFSTVAASYSIVTPQFHRVVPYMFSNLKLACQRLVARGYRRIGLAVTSGMDLRTYHHFTAAMAWHNATNPAIEPIQPLVEENLTAERIAAWLRRERPDVFITSASLPAFEAAERAGLRVPRDLGLVFHSVPSRPRSTAIDERPGEIGTTAVDLLAGMIQRGEKGIPFTPKVTMVEGAWLEGRTLRPLPKRRR